MSKLRVVDDDDEETFKDWLLEKLDDMFVDSLPMDAIRDLPPVYMYVVGTVVQITALALFVYFIIQGYQQGISQQYISLQSNNGICESVPAPLTGTFLADINGNWQASEHFDVTLAAYIFQFQDLNVDLATYSMMISNLQTKLEQYALLSQTSNLGINLLMWMVLSELFYAPHVSSSASSASNVSQTFALTGQPQYVFDRQYIVGSLLNATGRCNLVGSTSFDPTAGLLSIFYNYESYMDIGCNELMEPQFLGYDEMQTGAELRVTVDINSMIVAAGVNAGTYAHVHLTPITNSPTLNFVANDVMYTISEYTDIIYPGMDPLVCIHENSSLFKTASSTVCGVRVGATVALPILDQWGSNGSKFDALPCACQCESVGGPGEGWTDYCDVFDLLLSLMMFNEDNLSTNMVNLLQVQSQARSFHNADDGLIVAAYNASFTNAALSYTNDNPLLSSPEWLAGAFDFCLIDEVNVGCTLLTFNIFDNYSTTVSDYAYQLNNGSCTNSISISDYSWEKLAASPPAALTQDYYKCTAGVYSSVFNAVGIASGNVATVIPIVVLLVLPFFYFFLQAIGQVPPKIEYTKEELQDSLNALALQLLRMRDKKTRGLKVSGTLYYLTKELIDAAKVEGGYPDSDDSEDEGDDDDYDENDQLGNYNQFGKVVRIDSLGAVHTDAPRDSGASLVHLGDIEEGIELRSTHGNANASGSGHTDGGSMRASRPTESSSHRERSSASVTPQKQYMRGGRKVKGVVFTKHIEVGPSMTRESSITHRFPWLSNNKSKQQLDRESGLTKPSESDSFSQTGISPIHSNMRSTGSSMSRGSTSSSVRNSGYGSSRRHRAKGPRRYHNRAPDSDDEEEHQQSRESSIHRAHRGSSSNSNSNNSKRPKSYRSSNNLPGIALADLQRESEFAQVLLLNTATEAYKQSSPYQTRGGVLSLDSLTAICSELRRLLGECIMFEHSSVGMGDGMDGLARDSPSFVDAANLSWNLSRIDLRMFLQSFEAEKKVFLQLHTLLCMHASIALDKDVAEITDSCSRLVAYQIGSRVFTAAQVGKLCGDDSAYRESISGPGEVPILTDPVIHNDTQI